MNLKTLMNFTTILFLFVLLPIAGVAQFTDGVSLTVNGQSAQRHANNFSMLSACGQNQAIINVTAEQGATIKINGVTQNPATVNLTAYGNNDINITVTPQSGSPQNYTLIVNKPIPFDQIVAFEWPNLPTIINNPANNGGYTFTSFKWFRNGLQISTSQYIHIGPNGMPTEPDDLYYIEVTAVGVTGIIRTCTSSVSLP